MDKRKQSILKQEGRIPLQEVGLPDFPDDDTGTVTVTKSRRVSFGANFVKEFIVGSAISTQFCSEYEQAFSSSDSSNPNSSQSGILSQSSCINDDAIDLCVKPLMEDDFVQVKKKLCLEKQHYSFNNGHERLNDKSWDFNVSNNANIFAQKSNTTNKSENIKHPLKCGKKAFHNDSFLSGEKHFQNKQHESELNATKFIENTEKKNKPGKFSSTICFSVDSPTADMEFTEGCISLAKSIFDKKNKEMTVYIQEKAKEKKDDKTNTDDIIFNGSEVEMSLTQCVQDQSEDESFIENKSNSFDNLTPTTQSDGLNKSHENLENLPIHMYPLNVLLSCSNNNPEDYELERSLFFPERSLTEMLNHDPLKTSIFSDNSLNKDNNEECNMELSVCEPSKISMSDSFSADKDNNEECNMELPVCEPSKISRADSFSVDKDNNEECNMELSVCEPSKISRADSFAADTGNNEECNMELSICERLKISMTSDSSVEKGSNDGDNMELTNSDPLNIFTCNDNCLNENNSEEFNRDLSTTESLKVFTSKDPSLDKDNNGECNSKLSNTGPFKSLLCNTYSLDKNDDQQCNMELSTGGPLEVPGSDNNGECNSKLSYTEPIKSLLCNTYSMDKNDDQQCNMELSIGGPLEVPGSDNVVMDMDKDDGFGGCSPIKNNNQECNSKLSNNEPIKSLLCNTYSLDKNDDQQCNMELSICGRLEIPGSDNNGECNSKLSNNEPIKSLLCNTYSLDKNDDQQYNMELSTGRPLEVPGSDNDGECNSKLSNTEPIKSLLCNTYSLGKNDDQQCNMELSIGGPLEVPGSDNDGECNSKLSNTEPIKSLLCNTYSLDKDGNQQCNMELPICELLKIPGSDNAELNEDNNDRCDTKLSNGGSLKTFTSNKAPLESDKAGYMELATSESLKILAYDENSGYGYNTQNRNQVTAKGIEENKEESNVVENPSKVNESLHCSFMHVDMEVVKEVNEPEVESCARDPLSMSTCREEGVSLNEDKNDEYDVEMMDSTPLKLITYDENLKKGTEKGKGSNEVGNCSKDSTFSEVLKAAVEEVTKESLVKSSVIDLFRSSVSETEDICLSEDLQSQKSQVSLKKRLFAVSPVVAQDKGKPAGIKRMREDPIAVNSVSEGDKKIIALLKEQSQEINCCWKVESFAHNGDNRCWSFSCLLLGYPVIMKFRLIPPKDMSVVSFSSILERKIELLKSTEFQSEKNKTVVNFAFEKVKNYFDPESCGLDNVHKIPLFLDGMNCFLTRMNKVIDQLLRIMKEYPGSRLKKSILSFRLHSFPLMFSLSVMVDVNDPLQLSESSVTFEKHFGNFNTTRIKSVFNDCLRSEEVLIQFIRTLVKLVVNEERLRGCITNRSYIRLIT